MDDPLVYEEVRKKRESGRREETDGKRVFTKMKNGKTTKTALEKRSSNTQSHGLFFGRYLVFFFFSFLFWRWSLSFFLFWFLFSMYIMFYSISSFAKTFSEEGNRAGADVSRGPFPFLSAGDGATLFRNGGERGFFLFAFLCFFLFFRFSRRLWVN